MRTVAIHLLLLLGLGRTVAGETTPFAESAAPGLDAGSRTNQVGAERLPTRSFTPPKPVDFNHPPREYVTTNAQGWTLLLERELAEDHPDLARRALHRLDGKLAEVAGLLPKPALGVLRRLPIFLMLGEDSKRGGRDNGAEYFQKGAPEHFPQLDPRMGSSLVIYSAKNYVWLTEQWALQVLLHEFAHAWHLEQWPEKQPDIQAAYENAMRQGLYRHVRDVNGDSRDQAYAAVNQLEYFAELSCTYFFKGEFEPFDRAALKIYDPVGFAMLEKMWGSGPLSGETP